MKIGWWEGGVHIEPETPEEMESLLVMTEALNVNVSRLDKINQDISVSPIARRCYEKAVAGDEQSIDTGK